MVILLQRVIRAQIKVREKIVAAIDSGVLAFIGIERSDGTAQADRAVELLLGYRLFGDNTGKMNLSLKETGGGLLLVPQFTLAADTNKGLRPSFAAAAEPDKAKQVFDYLVSKARSYHPIVESGVFGAFMEVMLINDGPATCYLQAR